MLKIGDFSRLSRMSVRMLRHYDELGLLTPLYTDPASGYRYYGPAQLSRANRIRAFRDMGFGLQSSRATTRTRSWPSSVPSARRSKPSWRRQAGSCACWKAPFLSFERMISLCSTT